MATNKGNILVVDDNKSILATLDILLAGQFDNVKTISNPNLIITELKRNDINLVVLDMNFSAGINTGNEGFYWLRRIKETAPDTSVVMITAYGDVETAVKSLKEGATDFILKPWNNDKLIATLRLAVQLSISKKEVSKLKDNQTQLKKEFNREHHQLVGTSQKILDVLKIVKKVAGTDANILITGENGTGKELIAQELHQHSKRSGELLVSVDMGAIPETLFESELFGHTKGAFTDAKENRAGKFELADRGTLFLDEIGNLSFPMQAKLLTAIQSRRITRIGSNTPIATDIRLVCATNKDLDKLVADGLFREDLLYRINTIHIELPPLRERGNDIAELAEFFLKKFMHKYGKSDIRINSQSFEKLNHYTWPGNIRELQNTIEKAVILCDTDVIRPGDLYLRPAQPAPAINTFATLGEMEEKMINLAIEHNNGNLTAAAEQLGITRQTLYNRFKRIKPDAK